jgi:hypothetical protein
MILMCNNKHRKYCKNMLCKPQQACKESQYANQCKFKDIVGGYLLVWAQPMKLKTYFKTRENYSSQRCYYGAFGKTMFRKTMISSTIVTHMISLFGRLLIIIVILFSFLP